MTSRSAPGAVSTALVALAALLASVAGCAGNDGGDTRCDEFMDLSEGGRTSVVKKLLAEQSGAEPTEGTVGLTVSAATYHCSAPGSEDDLVRDVLG